MLQYLHNQSHYIIFRLQDQAALYIKKIEGERKKIEELDRSIAIYKERILEQKSRLGGVNAAQENNVLIQKQIQVLENRLNKSLLKYNEILAQNKVLRQKIDEYRRERVVFDGIYKKLERELHEKKKEMANIIKDSKNAYLIRDKSQNEMLALKLHAEKEKSEFENEFKDLGYLIKQQQINLEQTRLKQLEQNENQKIVLSQTNSVESKELMSPFYGAGSNNNYNNNNNYNIYNNSNTPLSVEKIQSYEDALLLIQQTMNTYDINDIVTRFLESEDINFSLFNYVNDINSEIERIEHNITEMRNKIEKYRGQGMSTDTQRKKTLRDLEVRAGSPLSSPLLCLLSSTLLYLIHVCSTV
jgi:coiled-coil domain-containing protein 63/114